MTKCEQASSHFFYSKWNRTGAMRFEEGVQHITEKKYYNRKFF